MQRHRVPPAWTLTLALALTLTLHPRSRRRLTPAGRASGHVTGPVRPPALAGHVQAATGPGNVPPALARPCPVRAVPVMTRPARPPGRAPALPTPGRRPRSGAGPGGGARVVEPGLDPTFAVLLLLAKHLPHQGSFLGRSEEHTSELQSLRHLVCRLLLEKKKKNIS